MENIYAEKKDDKIIIHTLDGKPFDLIPYAKTPDGDQQLFGIDEHIDRIVACLNDLMPIPTETIKAGFTGRMMTTVQNATRTVEMTKKVLEAFYAKEVKDQEKTEPQKTSDISSVPPQA